MKLIKSSKRESFVAGLLIALLTLDASLSAESVSVVEVGRFSAEKVVNGLPAGWEPFYFKDIKRRTDYRLMEEDGQVVVKAEAEASASGLIRKIAIDPKKYRIIQWRWKVADMLKRSDVFRKEGDDYPARIYVLFEYASDRLGFFEKLKYKTARMFYGAYPPLASINYIWASNAPQGTVIPNSYTERAMMFVVESDEKKLNTWVNEKRNVYEDYRNAFKDEPPMISGVAIMTDTDNTGESAKAYYGDILFLME